MFYKDFNGIYRVEPLAAFDWLNHGFGTRSGPSPADPHFATLRQIHSDICHEAERPGRLGEGDALITAKPGVPVGVKTADCVPILLVDPERRRVAAIHAGWKGTAQGIVAKTARRMDRAGLYAAIGPAIGPCCYEVGPEVAARFGHSGRVKLDLVEENLRQLLGAGLNRQHIYAARLCTRCLAGEFHSYRRDREKAGRQISFVGIVDGGR